MLMEVIIVKHDKHKQGVVDLFTIEGNKYHWNLEKWNHFYKRYPIKKPLSIVAIDNERVIRALWSSASERFGIDGYLGVHAAFTKIIELNSYFKSYEENG